MEKPILLGFIDRYTLGGTVNRVKWETTPFHETDHTGTLSTTFVSDDRIMLGRVILEGVDLGENTLGIYRTDKLVPLLRVLGNELQIDIHKKENGNSFSLRFTDEFGTKVNFGLSDLDSIPPAAVLKKMPPFEIEATVTQELMSTFVRATDAMSQEEIVTILNGGDSTQMLLGDMTTNSDRVTMILETDVEEEMEGVPLSAKHLREIFKANRSAETGTLRVSSKGFAHVAFETMPYKAEYYMLKKKTV